MKTKLLWQAGEPWAEVRDLMALSLWITRRDGATLLGRLVGHGPCTLWLRYADGHIDAVQSAEIAEIREGEIR